jgi:hypothetical protein
MTKKPPMSAKARAVLEKLRRMTGGRCIGCALLRKLRARG